MASVVNRLQSHFQKDAAHFTRWSQTYDDSWIQRYIARVHQEMLEAAAKEVAHPREVLDIGCGTGQLLKKAASLWPSSQIIGVDPSEGMLEVARTRLPSATFLLAGAESLPLADSFTPAPARVS